MDQIAGAWRVADKLPPIGSVMSPHVKTTSARRNKKQQVLSCFVQGRLLLVCKVPEVVASGRVFPVFKMPCVRLALHCQAALSLQGPPSCGPRSVQLLSNLLVLNDACCHSHTAAQAAKTAWLGGRDAIQEFIDIANKGMPRQLNKIETPFPKKS